HSERCLSLTLPSWEEQKTLHCLRILEPMERIHLVLAPRLEGRVRPGEELCTLRPGQTTVVRRHVTHPDRCEAGGACLSRCVLGVAEAYHTSPDRPPSVSTE